MSGRSELHRGLRRATAGMAAAALGAWAPAGAWGQASAAAPAALANPVGAAEAPAPPWAVVGLPHQSKPYTRFSAVNLDGERALRVDADASYGNLVHPLHEAPPVHRQLRWRWRVDEPNPRADLTRRSGEDIPVKVCAMFDLPLQALPFLERQVLRAARAGSDVQLPAATVCYIWDAHLEPGTQLDSVFTHRIRYIVLRGPAQPLHQWASEQRDIVADYLRLFGAESAIVPPLIGIAVGADADNTAAHSVAHVADLRLE